MGENHIEYTNWKQTWNILASTINPTKERDEEEDDDMILRASRYLLPLLLSIGDSDGIAKVAGLSDIGTLDGTKGTVLTPKRGRAADVEWADGGCSVELVGWEDRPVIVERADRGFSTEFVDWYGRLSDVERAEDGCSTELIDREDRPTDEERADGGCSWTERTV